MMNMMLGDFSTMGAFWGMGLIGMLLFWILIVLLIASLFKWLGTSSGAGRCKDCHSPLETLAMRYAKGEISKKEYDKMKKDLEKELS